MKTPLVSVCMITYNHEAFIAEAIDGVLMQKTDFSFELIIGEDRSGDKTRFICESYAARYPNIIRLLPAAHNMGMNPNFIRTNQAAKGKYIALCEGDDYWIDPHKLQKQIDFLEANPTYSFCFHRYQVLKDEQLDVILPQKFGITVTLNNVLFKMPNTTCTTLFKKNAIPSYTEAYLDFPTGDYLLTVLLAKAGRGYLMEENMAVYRMHTTGVFSSLKKADKHKTSMRSRWMVIKHLKLPFISKLVCAFAVLIFYTKYLLHRNIFRK